VAKPHYVQKVLIVGGESTGKSTLCQNLALAYNTNYVAEVGRDTCEYAGGEDLMIAEDLYENLLRQKVNVMNALKESNRICFVDTDALTTLFYAQFLLGYGEQYEHCKNLAKEINALNDWDLVLFLEPTVDFVQDGTRNEKIAADREKYSREIKWLVDKHSVPYECIDGDYLDRFTKAKEVIEKKLHVTTRW
jgi:HTH-type transcriptional repressor of NAD biosynthesis genes